MAKPASPQSPKERAAEEARAREVAWQVGVEIDELASLFLLESVRQFGPQKFKDLLEANVSVEEILDDAEQLPIGGKRGASFRKAIAELGDKDRELARSRAIRQIVRAHENEAKILTYRSRDYPRNVLQSNNPVPVLYVRGRIEVASDEKQIACVGSREIRSPYLEAHRNLASAAAKDGFGIVSGFATGADRIGHEAAYESGGPTVLVMPSGLDRPFPPENKELWQELLEYPKAAAVSEFPFGTSAAALTLRKRNKLIVSFGRGVFLSQTSARGGAMNAYRFALEQGKPIATIESDGSPGTSGNLLISEARPKGGRTSPKDQTRASELTTVLPLKSQNQVVWRQWLQTLSSLT